MILYCVNCKKDIEGILTSGKEIYPHRKDLYNLKFYKCPVCGNYVGCHKGTEKPLGCIPSRELKRYRMSVHDILDPLWKSKRYQTKKKPMAPDYLLKKKIAIKRIKIFLPS